MARTAVVAGVGPGLGASLARKFDTEGYAVGLFARSPDYIGELAEELSEATAVSTDIADWEAVRKGFETVREELGAIDVLVVNASASSWQGLLDVDPEAFDRALDVNVRGGFNCAREAARDMVNDDGGTIVFTGATTSVRGLGGAVDFSAAKFGARGLAESMAQELGEEGVHVAHVVIDGGIRPPGRDVANPDDYLDPDALADVYWNIVEQGMDTMTFEVHVTNGNGNIEFV